MNSTSGLSGSPLRLLTSSYSDDNGLSCNDNSRPMNRYALLLLPILFIGFTVHASPPDTFRVYFGFNQSKLPDPQQHYIDSLQYVGLLSPGRPVQLIGYCDEVGGESYNQ